MHTIRFCSVVFGVTSIVIVYSATARLVALALKNHEDGDFIARGAWWSNTRSIRPLDQRYKCHNLRDGGRRPPATMFTTPRLLQRQQQAYRLRIAIYVYTPCTAFDAPIGISPSRLVWKNLEWFGCHGEKISKISLFILTQLTTVTDTQTNRHTDRHRMTARIARQNLMKLITNL